MVCTGEKFLKIRVPRLTKIGFLTHFFVICCPTKPTFLYEYCKIIVLRCIIDASIKTLLGAIYKVRTHNLAKKQHFLLPDTHTYVLIFRQILRTYQVCNRCSFLRTDIVSMQKDLFKVIVIEVKVIVVIFIVIPPFSIFMFIDPFPLVVIRTFIRFSKLPLPLVQKRCCQFIPSFSFLSCVRIFYIFSFITHSK